MSQRLRDPRRLRTHHLQHGPRPRRPGRRPRRGLHLLRHHLLLEARPRSSPTWKPSSAAASAPSRNSAPLSIWLIDAVRHFGADEAARVFRKAAELRAQYPSIVGIGIGGDEARGPASLFKEPLRRSPRRRPPPHRPRRRVRRPHRRPRQHLGRHQHRRRTHRPRPRRPARRRTPRHPRRKTDPHRDQRHLQHPHRLLPILRRPPPAPLLRTRPHGHPQLRRPAHVRLQPPRRIHPRPRRSTTSPSTSSANSPPTPSKPASSPHPQTRPPRARSNNTASALADGEASLQFPATPTIRCSSFGAGGDASACSLCSILFDMSHLRVNDACAVI